MQQNTTQNGTGAKTVIDVENYPLVELTRKFAAPVERAW